MTQTRQILEVLHTFGHLPLSSALRVASKEWKEFTTEAYWKQILEAHFPSFYLLHLSEYSKGVSWKNEYKKAYQSLSLRYLPGANLQCSKVFHFAPTLDSATIDDINNHKKSYSLDQKLQGGSVIEGKVYHISPIGDLVEETDSSNVEPIEGAVKSNNRLFFGDYSYSNIESKKQIWKREVEVTYFVNIPLVVFDNKVMYTTSGNLVCLDALSGDQLFCILCPPFDYENPTKKRKTDGESKREAEIDSTEIPIAIDGDFVVWLVKYDGLHVVVANWKTQEIHGKYHLKQFESDYCPSPFTVSNGKFFINAICEDTEKESFCLALDLDLDNNKKEITELWKFGKDEGGMESGSQVAPCVYGDIVFDMFYYPTYEDELSWIVALDANSGKLIWRWKFNPGEPDDVNVLNPKELFVIEGTASIHERQHLREARKSGSITQFSSDSDGKKKKKNDEDENDDEEKEEEEEEEEEEEGDEDEGEDKDGGKDRITNKVPRVKKTTFPTLRFSLQNEHGTYFEGAAIAETGQLLFFNKKEDVRVDSRAQVISKHNKPDCLALPCF